MLHLQLTDREIEGVLAGQQPYGRPDLAEVARVVAHLRTTTAAESAPAMEPRLVAQLDAVERDRRAVQATKRQAVELARARAQREAAQSHRRWRLVGAAAIILMLGGVVVAGLQRAPEPSPTETEDINPADRNVDLPRPSETPTPTPQAEAEPPVTAPPPTPPPQVEAPQVPLDDSAQNGPGNGPPQVDWPFDWPEECTEGDFVCLWEEWQDRHRGPGGRP